MAMRILFVSNFYPPHDLGGMELRCGETVERLRRRGHACHVLTSRFGVRGRPPADQGITRALYLQADIHHYRPHSFFLQRPWQERANRRALRHALDEFRPDVVFVWGMWNLSRVVAYEAEQRLPGRVAYAVAGYWLMEPDAHESFWAAPERRPLVEAAKSLGRWWAGRALARTRAACPLALEQVACVSQYVRAQLSQAGVLPHGARVIYNGIDAEPFLQAAAQRQPAHSGLRLVYTGNLSAHKGVHTAVEALGLLAAQGQVAELCLTLVGGGHPDYEAELRRRVAELGLDGCVTFRGRLPRSEMAAELARHDVFLFTSLYQEPLARSVMEAMAAGQAVIGTAVGGQAEMLDNGVNALTFPPGDAGALAACILDLHQDPGQRARLTEAGRRMVLERFTLERMVDEMEEWLEELAG